ncbi:MAG: hypothetical protein AAF620_02705 [Bacteroidota bacterium]
MNKILINTGAIVVLLGINLFIFFFEGKKKLTDASSKYFDFLDGDDVKNISIHSGENQINMKKIDEDWILNDEYGADTGFVNTFISVLAKVESGRKMNHFQGEKLGSVKLRFHNNAETEFDFASNLTRTKSYFIKDKNTVEVSVPGYKDHVVDLFLMHPDQWRDRLVLDASWRSVQKLSIHSSGRESLEIRFDDKFFLVNNQSPRDSSAVIDYLNQFQYLEANEMISRGRFPQLDSLSETPPLAILKIDDIKFDYDLEIKVFSRISQQSYHLVVLEDKMMVIDTKRIKDLLASSEDFLGN